MTVRSSALDAPGGPFFYACSARPSELKDGPDVKTTTKRPAAQAATSKQAAAIKAENAAKRQQPHWLKRPMPALASETPPASERLGIANLSQGPPRLLNKAEVCAIAGATFPSVWSWMRQGRFPRSRIVGGKSMWLSTEVEQWLAALPIRKLKGDGEAA